MTEGEKLLHNLGYIHREIRGDIIIYSKRIVISVFDETEFLAFSKTTYTITISHEKFDTVLFTISNELLEAINKIISEMKNGDINYG